MAYRLIDATLWLKRANSLRLLYCATLMADRETLLADGWVVFVVIDYIFIFAVHYLVRSSAAPRCKKKETPRPVSAR